MIKQITKYLYYYLLFIRDSIYCYIKIGNYKKTWRFWGIPIISRFKYSRIIIGNNFVACSKPQRNTIGVNQKVILKTVAKNATINIGNGVGISGCTISSTISITIGDETYIGSGVLITDSDAHSIHPQLRKDNNYTISKAIIIEKNVFIGARSIILKGVTIGEGSVIGAGSVVTKSIPSMSIAAGNPAKVIGSIKDLDYYKNII